VTPKRLVEISIHLPLYYNPTGKGRRRRIEVTKLAQTYREVAARFGGYSLFKHVEGVWIDQEGAVYRDIHHVLFVLAADTAANRRWVKAYKKVLAERFEQKEIFITLSNVRRL